MASTTEPFDPLHYDNLAKSVVEALLESEPVKLPIVQDAEGCGVYALYYVGNFAAYLPISSKECRVPIYVGKTEPSGKRIGVSRGTASLRKRLNDHAESIRLAKNLQVGDFRCKYLVVKEVWIGLAEQFLIRKHLPVWNVELDGFGNHAPGKGRKDMIRPKWDTVHPGRPWAERLQQKHTANDILEEIKEHFASHPVT